MLKQKLRPCLTLPQPANSSPKRYELSFVRTQHCFWMLVSCQNGGVAISCEASQTHADSQSRSAYFFFTWVGGRDRASFLQIQRNQCEKNIFVPSEGQKELLVTYGCLRIVQLNSITLQLIPLKLLKEAIFNVVSKLSPIRIYA